jgi:Fe-S-cluster-containing hydrogenase component 2
MTVEDLARLSPFSSLAAGTLSQILKASRQVELRPTQRLSAQPRHSQGESYCFVLSGHMGIALASERQVGVADASGSHNQDDQFIGFFGSGELFSDGYQDVQHGEAQVIDCVASTAVSLLITPVAALRQQLCDHRDWAARLAHSVALSRRRLWSEQEPTHRVVQDFFLRRGYGASRRIRVAEVSDCLDCNKCERACARRHGHVRMNRAHAHLGRLALQRFCVNCTEQACLAACASGGLVVSQAGEIQVTSDCTGCGACARKCPFAAIEVVELPYTAVDFPSPVPAHDQSGQTAWPGVFAIGSICGPCAPKAAMEEAKRAVDVMPARQEGAEGVLDVIIVGAGVAGTSAAERCRERRLSCLVVDKALQLSAKARKVASVLPVQAGMEVKRLRCVGQGKWGVEVTQGMYVARNVLVCTGKPPPGQPSLLSRAGVPMIEPGTSQMQAYAASRGMHKLAVKCDNCAGFSDRACQRACPTGTMIELAPQDLFFEQIPADHLATRFSAVASTDGLAEHRARARRHGTGYAILASIIILALVGVGVEILLRRVWPAHSLAAMLVPWFGDHGPVSYKPSRGYGHWLGYVGTAFMLLTLFYPLRTRCGVLKNWGAQSTWLSVHLWVGFIGATLVTYHSALKLDRWVGLACYSMWLVVLSGAIGRYLYGILRSGLGLAEFQQSSIRSSVLWGALSQNLGTRYMRLLAPDVEKPGFILTELFVIFWHELRDFFVVLWLRFGGLAHLPSREERRQMVQLFSELAAYRRSRRCLESARRLVRYWNWVHIVLALAMFVLSGFHITYGFMYKAV